jgi:FkbM family methyltransferase
MRTSRIPGESSQNAKNFLMGYTSVKKIAQSLGFYRQARWFNRHFLNRRELHQEKTDLAFYSNFIHKDDLVFDVGANHGEKSRVFLKLGARVVAFEPQPDCTEELEARCGRNRRLITVQAALGSMTGKRRFYVRENRAVSGLIKDWEGELESEILVPTFTLDQMIAEHGKPLYIKIDVEGYEYEVLKGLSQPISYISFEYHLRKDGIEKAINCIHYISSLGELMINITPAENLILAYQEWLTKEKFFEVFPDEISRQKDYRYGDIFVKINASRASDSVVANGVVTS